MKKINKILIVQTAFIGDVILVTPLIRETKRLFPEAEIDIIVIPATKNILANNPYIDEILVFDKKIKRLQSFFEILRLIRKKKYDLALIPHSSFTSAFLAFLAGVRRRIGFRGRFHTFLMNELIRPQRGLHRIGKNLSLLEPFFHGLSDWQAYIGNRENWQTELFPSGDDEEKIKNRISENDLPLVAVAPGSVWKTKCWPEEYYSEIAASLRDCARFVFIGSNEERDLCNRIIRNSACNGINYAGELTLLQSAAAIRRCKLMICNDSGALHLANAMKTTVVAFFGPTVKRFGFYPYRENDILLEIKDIDCRPCSHHGPMHCPKVHHNCMRLITPANVIPIIRDLITD